MPFTCKYAFTLPIDRKGQEILKPSSIIEQNRVHTAKLGFDKLDQMTCYL